MNFLVLGDDQPDDSLSMFQQINDLSACHTEEQGMMHTMTSFFSEDFQQDMDKLRIFYQIKVGQLKLLFDEVLSDYGVFNLPMAGLSAWVKLKVPLSISPILSSLLALGFYDPARNAHLDREAPVEGILIGFGRGDVESWSFVFKTLAMYFEKSKASI